MKPTRGKIMKIYVLRHGTTFWNEEGRTQGRRQNKLSENGKKLAELTAEKLKDKQIDIVYASPLMRTMQTANIVNKYHNAKIIKSELLTEVDQGVFSGRLWRKLTDKEKQLKKERHPSTGMETLEEAYERTQKFVNDVLKSETSENVMVVTHNNICSMLELIFTNTTPDFSNHDQMNMFGNAEVRVYDI
jgi:broad specificity phosphatase PhoE